MNENLSIWQAMVLFVYSFVAVPLAFTIGDKAGEVTGVLVGALWPLWVPPYLLFLTGRTAFYIGRSVYLRHGRASLLKLEESTRLRELEAQYARTLMERRIEARRQELEAQARGETLNGVSDLPIPARLEER